MIESIPTRFKEVAFFLGVFGYRHITLQPRHAGMMAKPIVSPPSSPDCEIPDNRPLRQILAQSRIFLHA